MIINVESYFHAKNNATQGIMEALEIATKAKEPCTLYFSAMTYHMKSSLNIQTISIAHDDVCVDIGAKRCHILLKSLASLTVQREFKRDGTLTTIFCGSNNSRPQARESSILWVKHCSNPTIRNFVYIRNPVTSITIGFGNGNPMYQRTYGQFLSEDIINTTKIKKGDKLPYHQVGLMNFLLFFNKRDELSLKNMWIQESNGFGMLTECCHNIKVNIVMIKPKTSHIVTSHNGWKVFKCYGNVTIENFYFEGTQMDRQNIHGNYLTLDRQKNNNIDRTMCYAPSFFLIGSQLEFIMNGITWGSAKILDWKLIDSESRQKKQHENSNATKTTVGVKENRYYHYRFFFYAIPTLSPVTILSAKCFIFDKYICSDRIFRKIAEAGNSICCIKVLLENNHHEHLMNVGILISTTRDIHAESGNVKEKIITNNDFIDIGFHRRYVIKGYICIAIASQGFSTYPYDKNITIEPANTKNIKIEEQNHAYTTMG